MIQTQLEDAKEVLAIIGRENLDVAVHGKLDGTLPQCYEFNSDIVSEGFNKVLNLSNKEKVDVRFISWSSCLKILLDVQYSIRSTRYLHAVISDSLLLVSLAQSNKSFLPFEELQCLQQGTKLSNSSVPP